MANAKKSQLEKVKFKIGLLISIILVIMAGFMVLAAPNSPSANELFPNSCNTGGGEPTPNLTTPPTHLLPTKTPNPRVSLNAKNLSNILPLSFISIVQAQARQQKPCGYISGHVYEKGTNKPIPSVSISLYNTSTKEVVGETKTDEKGFYEFKAILVDLGLPNSFIVSAITLSGKIADLQTVTLSPPNYKKENVDFALNAPDPNKLVTVRVFDAQTGTPIQDIYVSAVAKTGEVLDGGLTNDKGEVSLGIQQNEEFYIKASDGKAIYFGFDSRPKIYTPPTHIDIPLQKLNAGSGTLTVRARYKNPSGGYDLYAEGIKIRIHWNDQESNNRTITTSFTERVRGGSITLEFFAEDNPGWVSDNGEGNYEVHSITIRNPEGGNVLFSLVRLADFGSLLDKKSWMSNQRIDLGSCITPSCVGVIKQTLARLGLSLPIKTHVTGTIIAPDTRQGFKVAITKIEKDGTRKLLISSQTSRSVSAPLPFISYYESAKELAAGNYEVENTGNVVIELSYTIGKNKITKQSSVGFSLKKNVSIPAGGTGTVIWPAFSGYSLKF